MRRVGRDLVAVPAPVDRQGLTLVPRRAPGLPGPTRGLRLRTRPPGPAPVDVTTRGATHALAAQVASQDRGPRVGPPSLRWSRGRPTTVR